LSPLAAARAQLTHGDDRRGGTRAVVRTPARFSASRNEIRGPAPLPGEHSALVLRELLGYDDAKLAALEASGVLVRHEPGPA
jgi:crotonobetainyl-CoA:carnitine CoA-transferase CaiB-like acyl-CoA transferase